MKKNIFIIVLILIVFNLNGCSYLEGGQEVNLNNELVYEDIVNEIIRFHVIANSNSDEDQNLKLKVRDRVIKFVSDNLKNCESINDAREFIKNNKDSIENIAKSVIYENGYFYDVTSTLSRENFPDKIYGDVVFPQGEYEAYRILIGEAKGENWWCVMFPPLCLVDGTKEIVDSQKVVNALDENKLDGNSEENENSEEIKFELKLFKVLFKNKS